jgi:PleD family two-component response regulator
MTRLREAMQSMPNLPFSLSFSAGLAQTTALESEADFESMLRSVDKALYRAKLHRDRIEVVEMADL